MTTRRQGNDGMNGDTFELMMTLPADARYAVAAREVAVTAAHQAGCADDTAETFGRTVEGTVRRCLSSVAPGSSLPLTIRRISGPVEVLVDGHTLAVQA